MRFDSEPAQAPRHGLLLLQALVFFLFFAFALRFWYLQVHKGEDYARRARENQLRQEYLYAPRGLLRDRHGELLAVNEPAYALALIREDTRDLDETLTKVSDWTDIDIEVLKKKVEQGKKRIKPFEPLILVSDLSFNLLARIEANALFWPGLEIVVRPRRYYPQGPLLAHILGYVAEANEAELEKDPEIILGDAVGKQGLEFVLEKQLRGKKGRKQLEVDATGRDLNENIMQQPVAGTNLSLSIDLDLQEYLYELLRGSAGAITVLDPFTGQILALVTQPSYDNNAFARGLTQKEWIELRDHPRHPMQNRAIQSVYPPGSVWKLLVAGCGLYHDMIDPKETTFCPGFYKLGRREFRCWKAGGHGKVDLLKSIVESCDVYYYKLGEKLGVDKISEFALMCGFGSKTGIDLPHEKSGLIPTKEWKVRVKNEPWQGGENLNLAIGQGYTLINPLQASRFIAALVNGGKILKPNLLKNSEPVVQGELPISEDARKLILEAMIETVNSSHGTARILKRSDAVIGGKTGTAQVIKISGEERRKTFEMPYGHRDHAWLATFGIKGDATYVVTVLVEHGGHGGSAAGPLVKEIYAQLFGDAPVTIVKEKPPRPAASQPPEESLDQPTQ